MEIYNVDTTVDLSKVKLWQYDNAQNLLKLIDKLQEFANENIDQFWSNWKEDVFVLDTANSFGLSLWGMLLGVERPSYVDGGQTILFNDEQYRTLLKGRVMLMNSNGSVKDINAYLNFLFPEKPVFVVDYQNMTIKLVFYYQPTVQEMAVIQSDGFLPVPAGVKVGYVIVPPDEVFGFYGQDLQTLDNGTFLV